MLSSALETDPTCPRPISTGSKIDEQAPDFTLEDAQGKRATLSSYRGKKKVILVFYRGHW
jgi:peroxiredoxin